MQLSCGGVGSFRTMVMKDYMGRIFISPVKFSPEQGPQFWVNIGFMSAENQTFPEWVEQMEGAQVSKDDYDAMMKDLKEYFESEAPTIPYYMGSMLLCACFFVVMNFESGMRAVLARHAHRFPAGVVIERKDAPSLVAQIPQEQAIDQYGVKLSGTVTTQQGKTRRHQHGHVWPPVGYNVILQVPREVGDDVRGAWPPGAAPARNRQRAAAAVPAQLSMPVASAVVQGVPVSPTPHWSRVEGTS